MIVQSNQPTHQDQESIQPTPNPPSHILLAYDSSTHAEAAVEFLNDLSLEKCNITILAVMPTQYITGHEELRASLEKVKSRLERHDIQVITELKAGVPAATINDFAEELNTDMIVIGAKGLRATLGILLGGVAQQVVEYSCCPVLVVRAPQRKLKRILLVTDGSEHSQIALDYLVPPCNDRIDSPRSPGTMEGAARMRCFWLSAETEVHAMHVLPPPISIEAATRAWTVGPEVLYPAPAPPIDTESLEAEEQREGERILNQASSALEVAGIKPVKVLMRGDAATEIINYTEEEEIDLIVCGSRGLSQVTGWLLGSVSRKLVHYAECSVLIVKARRR